jgi:hypothetical protein
VTRVHGILATLLLGLFAVACDDGTTGYDDLLQNRALWESRNINNYEFEFEWSCFCLVERTMPVRITVENNRITRVASAEENRDLERRRYDDYRTIDGLFDFLADAYRRAEDVRVEYHPIEGYPTSVYVDYQRIVADEELGFTVSDFMPVDVVRRP